MNIMRKISLIVAVAVVISIFPMQIFATAEKAELIEKEKPLTLQNIYEMYQSNCENTTMISKENNKYVYEIQNTTEEGNVVTSHIVSFIDQSGNQVLDITEKEKSDRLLIDKDRNIYADGNLVKIESDYASSNIGAEISPRGGHRIYWQNDAPYGSSSDYSKNISTESKKLTYTKPLADATVGAIVSIILIGFGLVTAASVAVGFIATALISYFGRNDSKGKAWSMKTSKYVHKTKGFNVSSHMSVHKYNFTYYGNTDYTGKIGSGTRFEVFAY